LNKITAESLWKFLYCLGGCFLLLLFFSKYLLRGGFFKGFLFEPRHLWQPISPCMYFFSHPSLLVHLARARWLIIFVISKKKKKEKKVNSIFCGEDPTNITVVAFCPFSNVQFRICIYLNLIV
jgi:hypothetical protein